jgi:tetratricopeptide (TPR) repeat protein
MLYAAVTGILEAASAETPVVLVLDDLHWADKPSLQLLRHLVAHSATQRLLIVGTYRDAELSSAHPLEQVLAAFHREPAGISIIGINGFDGAGVIAFMEAAAGHPLDEAGVSLAQHLSRETDGNPFFVSEMLRHLSESGAIFQDPATGRWVATGDEQLALPRSVRTVISTRVSHLGEDATKVLATASVIGRDFDLELLAAASAVDEDEVVDVLERAERADVVQEVDGQSGRYTFSHALIQHTIYNDLSATRRTRMHHQVGEAMERIHPNEPDEYAGELARHFLLAPKPTYATKAITYARRAGDAAARALAPDDAVRFFSQALELASQTAGTDPGLRLDLLIALGTAQRQAGVAAFRETLLEAARGARAIGDTERLVAAVVANNRFFFTSLGEVDADKVELLESALDALPETDTPQRAMLLAILCTEFEYGTSRERCLALAEEAKAMARRLGDEATLLEVLGRCGSATDSPSGLAGQLEEIDERMALAEKLNDPLNRFYAAMFGSYWAGEAGQFDVADDRIALARSLAAKLQQPALSWLVMGTSAARALSHGDPEQAEEIATATLELGIASGQPDAFGLYGAQLVIIRHMQGRLEEIVPLIAEGAEQNTAVPAYASALAYGLLESGDEAGARDLIDRVAAESFTFPEDALWFDVMVGYAGVAIELGLIDHAIALLERLAPFHDHVPYNGTTAHEPVAMYLGALTTVLGRYEEADKYFEEAQELNVRGGMTFAEANTKMFWGRMLRQRGGPGDAERGRVLLSEAREVAARRDYAAVERRATAELSKLG